MAEGRSNREKPETSTLFNSVQLSTKNQNNTTTNTTTILPQFKRDVAVGVVEERKEPLKPSVMQASFT